MRQRSLDGLDTFSLLMPKKADRDPIDEKRYPNLAAERAFDRAEHVKRAMANGLSKKEAERHADEELRGRED